MFKTSLPKWEFTLYLNVWVGSVLYSAYCFSLKANQFFQTYMDEFSDFSPSWVIPHRKKDVADYEWQTFKHLAEKICLYVLISTLCSEFLRKHHLFLLLRIWQIAISITFVYIEMGSLSLTIVLFQPTIFFTFLPKLTSKTLVWSFNAFILLLISIFKSFIATEDFMRIMHLNYKMAHLTILSIFWTNLRCISFALDFMNKLEKPGALKFFAYVLYLPLLFSGPFVPYADFQSLTPLPFSKRVSSLLFSVVRFLFWAFFTEMALHYVYVNAACFHPQWVETLDSWALYGYGYLMGQFFYIKYLVIYGLSTSFAAFEHCTVPSLPRCIGRVHLYSDMWKYFDAGLHKFLLNYIYLPLMNDTLVAKSKYLASFICFFFVYIWHGTEDYIFIWTCFNYIGVVCENIAREVKRKRYPDDKSNRLRRISCALASPLLVMSAVSFFYFFARAEIGHIFIGNILNDSFSANLLLLFIMYCCCQVSTDVRNNGKEKTK